MKSTGLSCHAFLREFGFDRDDHEVVEIVPFWSVRVKSITLLTDNIGGIYKSYTFLPTYTGVEVNIRFLAIFGLSIRKAYTFLTP